MLDMFKSDIRISRAKIMHDYYIKCLNDRLDVIRRIYKLVNTKSFEEIKKMVLESSCDLTEGEVLDELELLFEYKNYSDDDFTKLAVKVKEEWDEECNSWSLSYDAIEYIQAVTRFYDEERQALSDFEIPSVNLVDSSKVRKL